MKMFKCSCAKNWGDVAPLVLRVVAGIIFIMHGLQKTADVSMFGGFLGVLQVPSPMFFAWAVVILEIGGGIALILGFLTHWISKLFALEMLIAIFLVHLRSGFFSQAGGYEFALLLFAVALSLMITGAGRLSADEWLLKSCCGKCEGCACAHDEKEMV